MAQADKNDYFVMRKLARCDDYEEDMRQPEKFDPFLADRKYIAGQHNYVQMHHINYQNLREGIK